MARWMETLGTYDLKVQHRPGRKHMNADSLSRLPCGGCDHCVKKDVMDKDKLLTDPKTGNKNEERDPQGGCASQPDSETDEKCRVITRSGHGEESVSTCNWMESKSTTEIVAAQQSDDRIGTLCTWLAAGRRPTWADISHLGTEVKTYWAKWCQLSLKDGIVYRSWTSENKVEDRVNKLVLPAVYHEEAFKMLHEDPICGHLGFTRTLKRFQERFYWVGYKEDVRRWCAMCKQCQQGENQHKKPKAPLKQSRVGAILEQVALDILGPPSYRNGEQIHFGDS